MILLDTSAIYAIANRGDPNHVRARTLYDAAADASHQILVHSYIALEAAALLQSRMGLDASLQFLDDLSSFQVHWVTAQDHRQAAELLKQRGRRRLSLVDCASFVIMRQYSVAEALFFDRDFEGEGFAMYAG